MEYILAILLGVFVCLFTVFSFGLGVKYGLTIKSGCAPKLEPLKPILERKAVKESEKKDKETENLIKNLFSYNGETK